MSSELNTYSPVPCILNPDLACPVGKCLLFSMALSLVTSTTEEQRKSMSPKEKDVLIRDFRTKLDRRTDEEIETHREKVSAAMWAKGNHDKCYKYPESDIYHTQG